MKKLLSRLLIVFNLLMLTGTSNNQCFMGTSIKYTYLLLNFILYRYLVKLGRHYIKDSDDKMAGVFEYQVRKIAIHPDFNKRHLTNDIALLWIRSKYNQEVFFTDNVLPVCLPKAHNFPAQFYSEGIMGTVSGWGLLNETHSDASDVLQYVSVPGNY